MVLLSPQPAAQFLTGACLPFLPIHEFSAIRISRTPMLPSQHVPDVIILDSSFAHSVQLASGELPWVLILQRDGRQRLRLCARSAPFSVLNPTYQKLSATGKPQPSSAPFSTYSVDPRECDLCWSQTSAPLPSYPRATSRPTLPRAITELGSDRPRSEKYALNVGHVRVANNFRADSHHSLYSEVYVRTHRRLNPRYYIVYLCGPWIANRNGKTWYHVLPVVLIMLVAMDF